MIKKKLKSEDIRLSLVEPTPLTESNVNNIDSNYIFYEIESEKVEPVDEYDSLIDKYLDFAKNTKRSTDCLTFWKMYSDQLNDLSNIAKQYLGVQASSAGVERMFSISGHIFSSKRRRMGSKLFSELVFLKLNEQFM
jgi:hypothetical protein